MSSFKEDMGTDFRAIVRTKMMPIPHYYDIIDMIIEHGESLMRDLNFQCTMMYITKYPGFLKHTEYVDYLLSGIFDIEIEYDIDEEAFKIKYNYSLVKHIVYCDYIRKITKGEQGKKMEYCKNEIKKLCTECISTLPEDQKASAKKELNYLVC